VGDGESRLKDQWFGEQSPKKGRRGELKTSLNPTEETTFRVGVTKTIPQRRSRGKTVGLLPGKGKSEDHGPYRTTCRPKGGGVEGRFSTRDSGLGVKLGGNFKAFRRIFSGGGGPRI